jgi:MerR family redox-sensitive transcriptional activator SoxR
VISMHIGLLAKRIGIAPSAIRYYEKVGLLPPPARRSGRRLYGVEALGRLGIIQVAREAGFSVAETKTFLSGFSVTTRPAARWRLLAERKLAEFEISIARIERMKALLESSFRCECLKIEDCERAILNVRDRVLSKPPTAAQRSRK